jgi:aminoglycoside phosphotransferase (APT) family kinase protein
MSLRSSADVKEYLKTNTTLGLDNTEDYQVDELTGGTANWVYRLTNTADGTTSILKHAAPFVRSSPSMAFPAMRMDFEAGVLNALLDVLPHDEVVEPVLFLAYDKEAKLLRMGDGGERTLKDAYMYDPELNVVEAGARLGMWLAGLHQYTSKLDIGDNKVAKAIYRHSYNNVSEALAEFGLDQTLGERVNEQFGSKLQTDDGMVCHGDFWTGNVLVKSDPLRLTVVDWEMTRRGNGVTDVGQFAAEAWLLDRFHGGKGMLPAFLTAYREAKGEEDDPEWDPEFTNRQRIAIHFGTHIAYWPTRVEWGSNEETVEVVKIGSNVLMHALEKDYEWFKEGPLAPLFQSMVEK